MYCIKCGNNTQNQGILCENCETQSGFCEHNQKDITNRKKWALYLGWLGNVAILLGMLLSFVLIKTDAETDYVAKIFDEVTVGPVETEEAQEEQSEDYDEESEEEKPVAEEVKGYSYSIASYLLRTPLDKDNTEDKVILERVKNYVSDHELAPVDLSDKDTRESLEQYFNDDTMAVLEKYSEINVQGLIIMIVAVIALVVAMFLIKKGDFRWSLLFTLIGTSPMWNFMLRLHPTTAWEYQYGMYIFVGGIFVALIAGIVGGNTDRCPKCKTELPGGSMYCSKCGNLMTGERSATTKS